MRDKSLILQMPNGIPLVMSKASHEALRQKPALSERAAQVAGIIGKVETSTGTRFDRPVYLVEDADPHSFGTAIDTAAAWQEHFGWNEDEARKVLGGDPHAVRAILRVPLAALTEESGRDMRDTEATIAHELGHVATQEIGILNQASGHLASGLRALADVFAVARNDPGRHGVFLAQASACLESARIPVLAVLEAAASPEGRITPESILDGYADRGSALLEGLRSVREWHAEHAVTLARLAKFAPAEDDRTRRGNSERLQHRHASWLEEFSGFVTASNLAQEFVADDFATRYDAENHARYRDKSLSRSNALHDMATHPSTISRIERILLLARTRDSLRGSNGGVDETEATARTNRAMLKQRAEGDYSHAQQIIARRVQEREQEGEQEADARPR